MNQIDPEIIISVLTGEATEEEERALAEWRAEDPENERRFHRLARIWSVSGDFSSSRGSARDSPPDAREIVERAEARSPDAEIADFPRKPPAPSQRSAGTGSRWRMPALAASLVLALGLGALLSRSMGEERLGVRAMVTGADQVATVTLDDGTVARLAPESRLEVYRDGDDREVSLQGRAFFAVAPQDDEPFRVRLPGGSVKVLGTRFDVESRDDRTQVAVVEGEVRMKAEGARVSVRASQLARASAGRAPEVQDVDDVFRVVDWVGQFLAFESTPMVQVAEEMRRRFGLQVEIADSALRRRTVTAWFSDQTPEEMMAGICRAVNARCMVRDGAVRMELSPGTRPGSSVDARAP